MPLVALRSGCPGSRKCPWICQCSVVTRRPKQLVELGFVEGFKIPKTANGSGAAHGTEASMSLVSGHSEDQSSSTTRRQGGQDGHQYVLSDVVLLSKTQQFGATDLGQTRIENFFTVRGGVCSETW